jgi:hypothetical protein
MRPADISARGRPFFHWHARRRLETACASA